MMTNSEILDFIRPWHLISRVGSKEKCCSHSRPTQRKNSKREFSAEVLLKASWISLTKGAFDSSDDRMWHTLSSVVPVELRMIKCKRRTESRSHLGKP
eukprot:10800_3